MFHEGGSVTLLKALQIYNPTQLMAKHTRKHTCAHIPSTFTDSCLLKHACIPLEDGPDVYNEPSELVLMDVRYKVHLRSDFLVP